MYPLQLNIVRIYGTPGGRDPRVRRTIDFLARKGFLRNDTIHRPYRGLLTLNDVLWVCEHSAPELYEVIPVARLRFPGHLPGRIPHGLEPVLEALRAGADTGPTFRGHAFDSIKSWLQLRVTDGRASPILTTHVHYRIPSDLARRIVAAAASAKTTAGTLVTEILCRHFNRER